MAVKKNRVPKARKVPCPDCGGTGRRKTAIQLVVPEVNVHCETCKGTGKIAAKPKDHIDELYDSFKKKDMSRREFRKAYKRVLSPGRSKRDLGRMFLTLEIERQSREQIDRRLAR